MGTKAFLTAAAVVVLGLTLPDSSAAQTATNTTPRTPYGKPDLNGIWQALNEANYDIEAHVAHPAMALRPGRLAQIRRTCILPFATWTAARSGPYPFSLSFATLSSPSIGFGSAATTLARPNVSPAELVHIN